MERQQSVGASSPSTFTFVLRLQGIAGSVTADKLGAFLEEQKVANKGCKVEEGNGFGEVTFANR